MVLRNDAVCRLPNSPDEEAVGGGWRKKVGGLIWKRGVGKYGWSRWRTLVSSGVTGAVNALYWSLVFVFQIPFHLFFPSFFFSRLLFFVVHA